MRTLRSNSGFSTILAILLTGFLIVLSAGVLFLFLSENQINRALYDGVSSFHAAEWAMEYALLKAKNHREWFADDLDFDSAEGQAFKRDNDRRAPIIAYSLNQNAKSYSGSIPPQWFEIIPLFYEDGKQLSAVNGKAWKDPRKPTTSNGFDTYRSVRNFTLTLNGTAIWNLIGNDATGKTYGISGQGSEHKKIGVSSDPIVQAQMTHEGSWKDYQDGELTEGTKTMEWLLSNYLENYLVLYNAGSDPVTYEIVSPEGFSLPTSRIVASAKIRNSITNLELTEDKSRLFDALKYSLFVK